VLDFFLAEAEKINNSWEQASSKFERTTCLSRIKSLKKQIESNNDQQQKDGMEEDSVEVQIEEAMNKLIVEQKEVTDLRSECHKLSKLIEELETKKTNDEQPGEIGFDSMVPAEVVEEYHKLREKIHPILAMHDELCQGQDEYQQLLSKTQELNDQLRKMNCKSCNKTLGIENDATNDVSMEQ
jgi:septal ring factor EnvC (AmiA/AmiB activator)